MRIIEWATGIVVALVVFVALAGAVGVAPAPAALVAVVAGVAASFRPGTPDPIRLRAQYRRGRR